MDHQTRSTFVELVLVLFLGLLDVSIFFGTINLLLAIMFRSTPLWTKIAEKCKKAYDVAMQRRSTG